MAKKPRTAYIPNPSARARAVHQRLVEHWYPKLVQTWRALERSPGGDELTDAELEHIAQHVREISGGLTRQRELIGQGYMSQASLLGAYMLFYWPGSYAQMAQALGHLPDAPGRVLELGAGPGPASAAALDAGALALVAWDHAAPALERLRELMQGFDAPVKTQVVDLQGRLPAIPKVETIIANHVINELWGDLEDKAQAVQRRASLLMRLVEESGARALVLVEPALKETSRALLELRGLLLARGFAVQAPCLHQGACPALERDRDWCHGEVFWQQPALVERLGELAGLNKRTLPTSYLVLTTPGQGQAPVHAPQEFRVVSEALHTKGRLSYMGCGVAGRMGLTLQERHEGRANAQFAQLARYDVVRIEGGELKGDGLRVGADDEVTALRDAWGAPR